MQGASELIAAAKTLAASPAFVAFLALDDAAVALGSAPHEGRSDPAIVSAVSLASLANWVSTRKRAQTDIAHAVLTYLGRPMRVGELVAFMKALGMRSKNANLEYGFASSLSRDDRFQSVRINGRYLWKLRAGWELTKLAGKVLQP